MKIDTIVTGWDGHPGYQFGAEINSRIYPKKYGCKQFIFWTGTGMPQANITCDCMLLDPSPAGWKKTSDLNWIPTLAYLWGTTKLTDATIMVSGLDQVVLCDDMFRIARHYPENVLIVAFAGCPYYEEEYTQTCGYPGYPDNMVIGRSETFAEILGLPSTWEDAVDHIVHYGLKGHTAPDGTPDPKWCINEGYLAKKVNEFPDQSRIIRFDRSFFLDWDKRRCGRAPNYKPPTIEGVREGRYSEIQCTRPPTAEERAAAEYFLNS